MNGTHRLVMLTAILAAGLAPAAGAQPAPATAPPSRTWSIERQLGAGPGAAFGFEANPRGTQFHLALSVGRPSGSWRLRPEGRRFILPEQAMSPCLVTEGTTCFQTARRQVATYALAVEARLPFLRRGQSAPYVAAGVGAFHARTHLRSYAACAPGPDCGTNDLSRTYTETSPGLLLALGATMQVGRVPAFWEAGFQRARARRAGTGSHALERFTGYTLLPFSLGVRW